MRGALSAKVNQVHTASYLPSMTNIATVIYEDTDPAPATEALERHRKAVRHQLEGIEALTGTYPFDLETSHRAYRINDFLHRLIIPEHRERFLNDQEALFDEFKLTEKEREMIRGQQWIEMIRYGVIFFLLEKMGAVVGASNPHIYASMRGEDMETFQKSRNVSIQYSVGSKA